MRYKRITINGINYDTAKYFCKSCKLTKIMARTSVVRCPECGFRMVLHRYRKK